MLKLSQYEIGVTVQPKMNEVFFPVLIPYSNFSSYYMFAL